MLCIPGRGEGAGLVPEWLPWPLPSGALLPSPSSDKRATRADLVLEGVAGGVVSSPASPAPDPGPPPPPPPDAKNSFATV